MCRHSRERYELPDGSCAVCRATCDGAHTLEEVAAVLGITRERVRQIEARALRRIKLYREDLRDHLETGEVYRDRSYERKVLDRVAGPYRWRNRWQAQRFEDSALMERKSFATYEEARKWMKSIMKSKSGSGE